MSESKLDWKQYCCWGCDLNAINLEWHTNWPKLMQLWQKIILIPSSTAIVERRFSKQNAIKSHLRNKLNLKTLDALMQVSLCGLEVDAMDWATILNISRIMRDQRILMIDWLIVFFFVTNQDCILVIQNISFSKILWNPKLKWHSRIRCIYQLTFISVFENVTWHFRFEVQCQIKFVKHTHWPVPMQF